MSAALVLLSGGLDSTVCLALAVRDARADLAVTFDYGQRHAVELERASRVAEWYGIEHLVVGIDLARWGGSALTDSALALPEPGDANAGGIPSTYVPARNLVFCALACGIAEARGADAVYLGVNALDYSGYPDCRPEFMRAFQKAADVGLKRGVEGRPVRFRTPLIQRTKAEIVRLGADLGAPVQLTWSCYRGDPRPDGGNAHPCGSCEACALRAKGFADAGLPDPALP